MICGESGSQAGDRGASKVDASFTISDDSRASACRVQMLGEDEPIPTSTLVPKPQLESITPRFYTNTFHDETYANPSIWW